MANSRERRLRFARLYSAGRSLRAVRSPVAPKMTMAQGPLWGGPACAGCAICSNASNSFSSCGILLLLRLRGSFRRLLQLNMAPELLAHGAQQLFRETVLLARAEPRVQRGRQHVRRYGFIQRSLNGPAA